LIKRRKKEERSREEHSSMPANLPPMYFEAEKRFRDGKTPEEKIEALEEMLAIMPKHKGTDKLKADLRRKIAKSFSSFFIPEHAPCRNTGEPKG